LQSNFSIVEAIRKSGPGSNKRSIPDMINWVRRIGYEVCNGSDEYRGESCLTEMSSQPISTN
jgi:hypothetical protein